MSSRSIEGIALNNLPCQPYNPTLGCVQMTRNTETEDTHLLSNNSTSSSNLDPQDKGATGLSQEQKEEVVRKVSWKLLPPCFLLTFICFVDRTNLGLAADSFCHDIGISSREYGTGVGLLFLGYAAFQVPSNIILHYVGAPLWLGIILVWWGVSALSMAFVTTPQGFYAVRFMLGLAESGTFPGLWYYFTHFFPGNRLTIPYTISELGVKSSQVVSAPIAAGLLAMGGFMGVKDWQWLFFLEGIPPVILGVYIWFNFPGDSKRASWLTKDESSWLVHEIAKYETGSDEFRKQQGLSWLWCQFKEVVRIPGLWIMTLIKFLKDFTTNVTLFWTPLIIQTMLEGHSLSNLPQKGKTCSVTEDGEGKHGSAKIALLTTIPSALAMLIGMTNGWHSQKVGERKYHMSFVYMAGGAIFVLMPWVTEIQMPWSVIFGVICLIGAISGAMGAQGILISLVTTFSGNSKAVGLALFNSVSNLGGYFGPQITGWMLNAWGSYTPVIVFLAITLFASGLIGAFLTDPLDKVQATCSRGKEEKEEMADEI